jgi:hypothetical protein
MLCQQGQHMVMHVVQPVTLSGLLTEFAQGHSQRDYVLQNVLKLPTAADYTMGWRNPAHGSRVQGWSKAAELSADRSAPGTATIRARINHANVKPGNEIDCTSSSSGF